MQEIRGTMARTSQKRQAMLNTYLRNKQAKERVIAARPSNPADCKDKALAQRFLHDINREISHRMSKIVQMDTFDESAVRKENDEINKLLREKAKWSRRFSALGGQIESKSFQAPGKQLFFGVAKQLPEALKGTRKRTRDGDVPKDADADAPAEEGDDDLNDDAIQAAIEEEMDAEDDDELDADEKFDVLMLSSTGGADKFATAHSKRVEAALAGAGLSTRNLPKSDYFSALSDVLASVGGEATAANHKLVELRKKQIEDLPSSVKNQPIPKFGDAIVVPTMEEVKQRMVEERRRKMLEKLKREA